MLTLYEIVNNRIKEVSLLPVEIYRYMIEKTWSCSRVTFSIVMEENEREEMFAIERPAPMCLQHCKLELRRRLACIPSSCNSALSSLGCVALSFSRTWS